MKLKKSSVYLSYRILALEIVSGIILLCVAFWIRIHADIFNAGQRLSSTVNYVKEQCNNNQRMELASETKSLSESWKAQSILIGISPVIWKKVDLRNRIRQC